MTKFRKLLVALPVAAVVAGGVAFVAHPSAVHAAAASCTVTAVGNSSGFSRSSGQGITGNSNSATATFQVTGSNCPVSFASWEAPNGNFTDWNNNIYKQWLYDRTEKTFNSGTYTLTVSLPNCYTQADLYSGTNIFITSSESPLAAWVQGGTQSCTQPAASCSALNVTEGDNRTATVESFKQTSTGGAVYISTSVDWGDGSTPFSGANPVGQTHSYGHDGTYKIAATVHDKVYGITGTVKDLNSTNCVQNVSFTTPPTPPATTTTTPQAPAPTELVNTGPGQVFALFGLTAAVAAIGHYLFSRRFARQ